jgi:hypothetical protein
MTTRTTTTVNLMLMTMEIWMDLLYQIKTKRVTLRVMENRPFLANPEPSSSRNAPLPDPEPIQRPWTPERQFYPQVVEMEPPRQKSDPFAMFKENNIGLILLGIVIGVIIMNMRPIIVNPMK